MPVVSACHLVCYYCSGNIMAFQSTVMRMASCGGVASTLVRVVYRETPSPAEEKVTRC